MLSHSDKEKSIKVLNINYGEKLKELRKQKHLSQIDVEVQSNLAFGTISRIENGKINPSKETLFKIAIVLDLNKEEFLQLFCVDYL